MTFQFLWLPLAHVFGSVLIAAQLQIGFVTAVDGRVPKIVENLPVVKPTFMGAVPRIFEKVYLGVKCSGCCRWWRQGEIASWAFGVGRSTGMRNWLTARHRAECSALSSVSPTSSCSPKVRDRLGGQSPDVHFWLGRTVSDVAEWFNIVGMPIARVTV